MSRQQSCRQAVSGRSRRRRRRTVGRCRRRGRGRRRRRLSWLAGGGADCLWLGSVPTRGRVGRSQKACWRRRLQRKPQGGRHGASRTDYRRQYHRRRRSRVRLAADSVMLERRRAGRWRSCGIEQPAGAGTAAEEALRWRQAARARLLEARGEGSRLRLLNGVPHAAPWRASRDRRWRADRCRSQPHRWGHAGPHTGMRARLHDGRCAPARRTRRRRQRRSHRLARRRQLPRRLRLHGCLRCMLGCRWQLGLPRQGGAVSSQRRLWHGRLWRRWLRDRGLPQALPFRLSSLS